MHELIKQKNDEFLLLACDGVYDVMTNDELIAYLRWRFTSTRNLVEITNEIVDACLSKVL